MLTIALLVLAKTTPEVAAGQAPVAIVVARATIMSGVRIDGESMVRAMDRRSPMPKPREVACPSDTGVPCRLITVDMP